jgi:hypothetical protein
MPTPKIELPKYPAGPGPAMARASDTYRGTYQRLAQELRRELQRCEEAFADGLARTDAAAATRSRIDSLATAHRKNGGR